jgi:GT2 family glycosyltransferase
VTAVVVAHDGARLLPGLIAAVREQTHPVHRAVGVDTGSRDRSGATLAELLGPDAVFGMELDTGFGAAVARALRYPAARTPAPEAGADGGAATEWIWLLHDDCEPAADALEQLLRAASRSRSAAVLGPKLRDSANRRVLREVGISIDRAGRRITGIEPGEIDQGQHDGSRTVLAVSSAGMLVRRDVWDQVGGFDPALPLFRDDIDFCWRVHAAGYDVRVIPDAVVYHRELSSRQFRQTPATGGHPRLVDRRSALYVFAVNLPLWPMAWVLAGGIAGSLVRAAYFLVTKQQRKAAAHLGAVAWLLRHPILLWRARRRRAADRRAAYAVLRPLLPRSRTLARFAEHISNLLSSRSGYDTGGLHHAVVDNPDDDLPLPDSDSVIRRVLTHPGVLLVAGLAVVALVAARSLTGSVLTGSGVLGGGALIPAWGGAGGLWHEYLAGYHDVGVGSAASTPPYVGVMAVLATVLGGSPWLAVDVLLLGCVPAAGLTAYLATRRLTSVLPARIWIAASYALLPVAMGAVAAGRIGTAAAFILLPLIAIMIGRMRAGPPRAARRAAWAAGLLVAIAAAFVPLIWPIAALAALAAVAAWRWLGLRTAVNAVIVAVVPAAVLIPWTFHLVTSPSMFFTEAGIVRPGLAAAGLRPEALLLLSPGGPGLPPAWVTAGLLLPAFGALLLRRRIALVCTGWGIAIAGMAIAVLVSRAQVTPPQGGAAVSAWPGIAIAVAAAGLLLAATPMIELAAQPLSRPLGRAASLAGRASRGDWRVLVTLAGFAVAASAPLLAAGYWLVAGVSGPVAAASPQILPAFVAASSTGADRDRTLVLRSDDGALAYTVLRTTDPLLGEPELPPASSSARALAGVVAALSAAGSGDAGDTGQSLSEFDIGYVLLPAPIDQALAQQLNAAAGLQPLTTSPAYDLWQVSGTVARTRVVTAAGAVVPISSGAIGVNTVIGPSTAGTLVLAEAAGGWSATLNGKPLTKVATPVDGWAQGFVLPAGGGHLVISRDETARDLSLAAEAILLLAVFAFALPGTRSSLAVPAAATASPDGEAAVGAGRRSEHPSGPRVAARRKRRPGFALPGLTGRGAADARDATGDATGDAAGARGIEEVPAAMSGSGSDAVREPVPAGAYDRAAGGADDPFASAFLPASAAPYDPPAEADDRLAYNRPGAPGYDRGGYDRPAATGYHSGQESTTPETTAFGSDAVFGSGPADDHAARANWGAAADAGPPAAVSATRPAAPPARAASTSRGRGGAHAAKHGKPSRRRRGSGSERSDDQGTAAATEDNPQAESSPESRAPWERGAGS